jgi:uncharacterized protein DUF3606
MGEDPTKPEADEHIDIHDDAAVGRWASRLCTTPEALREAVAKVGSSVAEVKRHLLTALLRSGKKPGDKHS